LKAIQVSAYGGPEVLAFVDVPEPRPKAGEALVRIGAIGVNFIDVYHRTGRYPGHLPFTPGMEAAGVVEAVGPDVTDLKPGDRVASPKRWAATPGTPWCRPPSWCPCPTA
jgi:NADPH2:quinone reductase